MSNTSLMATIGLDVRDFKLGLQASRSSLKDLDATARTTGAQIALLERQMTGGGTKEQIANLEALRGKLRETQVDLKNTTRHMEALQRVQPDRGPAIELAGGKRLKKSAMAVEGAALGAMNGGDTTSAILSGVQGAAMGLQLGAGPLVAIGALGLLTAKLHESQSETKALRKDLDDLGLPMAGGRAASIEDITARLKASAEVTKKLEEAQGQFMHVAAGSLSNGGIGALGHLAMGDLSGAFSSLREGYGKQQKQDEEGIRRGREERERFTGRLADRAQGDLALDVRADNGDDGAALERIRKKHAEERASLDDKHAKGEVGDNYTGLLNASKEREAFEIRIAQRSQLAARASLALEEHILGIKKSGGDVEVQIAQAKADAAREAYRNGPKEGHQEEANRLKVSAANEELRMAQRVSAEHERQLGDRMAVALLTDNADQRHLLALALEGQRLKEMLESGQYSGREKDNFRGQLIDNHQAQRTAQDANVAKQNEMWMNDQRAGYQRGFAGQRQAVTDRQTMLAGETNANTLGTNTDGTAHYKDASLGHRQVAEAAQLAKQLQEIDFNEKQRLATIETQSRAIKEQGFILTGAQKKKNITEQFQGEIDKANFNNDPATAKLKTQERDAKLREVDIEEASLSPGERLGRARFNQQRADMLKNGPKPHTRDADRDGSAIHDATGPDASMTGATNAYDNPDNDTAGSFDTYFNPGSDADSASAIAATSRAAGVSADQIRAGAENAGKTDGPEFDSEGIISAVQEVVAAVKAISMKNQA